MQTPYITDMPINDAIKMNYFLAPFAFLYGLGVRFRNQLFSWGMLPARQYAIPIICVGNLSAGGTGKTPHTEYIVDILRKHYRVAVLSRGYKRKTRGFVLADAGSSSRDIGDEPFQIKQKYPDVSVAVDANRRRGILKLQELPEKIRPEVIVLDDAFQHRYVTPSLSIVLTDLHRLFYADRLLPAGRLREPADSIRRADVVIVTKCEEGLKPIEFRIMEEDMHLQAHQELFFTRIVYEDIRPVFADIAPRRSLQEVGKEEDILAIAGIASPQLFISEVEKYSAGVVPMIFPDHHGFGKQDFRKIKSRFDQMQSGGKFILVTEKDAARLVSHPLLPEEWKKLLYYLPIGIDFCMDRKPAFDQLIQKHIITIQRNKILRL